MKLASLVIAFSAVLACGAIANANVLTFTPNPADLDDLCHDNYYTWGMTKSWAPQTVLSASLTFKNIYDWTTETNVLYIHLLDNPAQGVTTFTDNSESGDAFAGQGIVLTTYNNLSTTPQTLTYNFTAAQVTTLNQYAADGTFGLGFDPDCHFYNDGVTLTLDTGSTPVPEPATVGLLLVGGTMGLFKKYRRTKTA